MHKRHHGNTLTLSIIPQFCQDFFYLTRTMYFQLHTHIGEQKLTINQLFVHNVEHTMLNWGHHILQRMANNIATTINNDPQFISMPVKLRLLNYMPVFKCILTSIIRNRFKAISISKYYYRNFIVY